MVGLVFYTVLVLGSFAGVLHAQPPIPSINSRGCGHLTTPVEGRTTFIHRGQEREYWIHIPNGYTNTKAQSLVILFHGWGSSGSEWYKGGQGFGFQEAVTAADKNNFILVAPTGLSDSQLKGNCDKGSGYCSWNAAGTSGSVKKKTPTCNETLVQKGGFGTECYKDTCTGADQCSDVCAWTTCNDDVGFVHDLLDFVENNLCVDQARMYAGGESNGGAMTWELAMDSRGSRFAAFAAVIGLPSFGFGYLPTHVPMPIMGVWVFMYYWLFITLFVTYL